MSAINTALSGLSAASTLLDTSAGNIANLDTPGYRARRANLVTGPGGEGVRVSGISEDPTDLSPDGSNVDLATEVVSLSRAKTLYNGNALVVKVALETTGTLLDVLSRSDPDHDRDHDRDAR